MDRPVSPDQYTCERRGCAARQFCVTAHSLAARNVVLGVSMKMLSHYVNHLLETPVDEAFAPERREAPRKAA